MNPVLDLSVSIMSMFITLGVLAIASAVRNRRFSQKLEREHEAAMALWTEYYRLAREHNLRLKRWHDEDLAHANKGVTPCQ